MILTAQWGRLHLQCKRRRFDPWVGRFPWRREKLPTPVFLPGESHGQSMVGYGPWGGKESDVTEATEHSTAQQRSVLEMIIL